MKSFQAAINCELISDFNDGLDAKIVVNDVYKKLSY